MFFIASKIRIKLKTTVHAILILATLFLTAACNPSAENHTNQKEAAHTTHIRFDSLLFAGNDSVSATLFHQLQSASPSFFNLYLQRIIHLPPSDSSAMLTNLNAFVKDKDVQDIYNRTKKVFPSAETEKMFSDVESFLNQYQHYFGKHPVKQIVTYISAFNYNIITTDSIIGVGLDMYLGSACEFYPSIGIPAYAYRRFSKEYIVNDVIKGWFQSDYDVDHVKKELLSQMIYYGKLLYFTDVMAPDLNDSIKIGYTAKQLAWCKENSKQMWAFYIEKKLLYSTNEMEYMKFVGDGNTTQGFPEGAPAKTAQWLGWQIVRSYMKNNKTTLPQMLQEADAQKILEQSGFKP